MCEPYSYTLGEALTSHGVRDRRWELGSGSNSVYSASTSVSILQYNHRRLIIPILQMGHTGAKAVT